MQLEKVKQNALEISIISKRTAEEQSSSWFSFLTKSELKQRYFLLKS